MQEFERTNLPHRQTRWLWSAQVYFELILQRKEKSNDVSGEQTVHERAR